MYMHSELESAHWDILICLISDVHVYPQTAILDSAKCLVDEGVFIKETPPILVQLITSTILVDGS